MLARLYNSRAKGRKDTVANQSTATIAKSSNESPRGIAKREHVHEQLIVEAEFVIQRQLNDLETAATAENIAPPQRKAGVQRERVPPLRRGDAQAR
jgi:hypothetical protein